MCKSARWWVASKGSELSPCRLWTLLLLLGMHYAFVAFNHTMFVFQAYKPTLAIECPEETAGCQGNCSDRNVFFNVTEVTIVTEWSLVCTRAALRPLMATLYFSGVAAGALLFGLLADRLGRRPVMAGCLLGQAILGVALAFAPTLTTFAVLRTLHGVFVQGLQGSTFTLLLELFPTRLRTAVAVVLEIYWALGLAVLAWLAYLLPHWRHLQLAVSVPTLATLLLLPWVPESHLWLATRKGPPSLRRNVPGHGSYREKHEEAEIIDSGLTKLADPPSQATFAKQVDLADAAPVTTSDLLTESTLRTYTLCMNAVWFTVPLSYYVTTFGMPSLSGDRFANFAVGAALEVVAYCATFVALSSLGRRLPLFAFLAGSAAACLYVAYTLYGLTGDGGVLVLVLVLGVKGLLVSAFCTMFLYTGELFPTAVRSAALGVCGLVGRFGNLLSPLVGTAFGDGERKYLPFVFIGGILIGASGLTLLLPETLGKELPSTLEDARALRRRVRGPRAGPRSAGDPASVQEHLLDNGESSKPRGRKTRLNLEDYKVPDWKSDVPQLEPETVQTSKKRSSMTALELGQGILDELNMAPCTDRTQVTHSGYLETDLDDPLGGTQYKSIVASAL